jgi:hypothetical protein
MKIVITESQYQKLVENVEIIDDILDKLGEIGYENLNNDEKMTLNRYSEWLNSGQKDEFMGEITPKNDDYDDKIGEEYTTNLRDGSEFSFMFDYEDLLDDENLYHGNVKWHGEEWIGLIATNKSGKLTEMDFIKDYDALQSYDEDDEMGGYDEGKEVRLQNELGNDLHQVKYFFQEEVIPSLMG